MIQKKAVILVLFVGIMIIAFHTAYATELPATFLLGHTDRVLAVAFSPEGTILASAGMGDNAIRLWNVKNGTEIAKLDGHDGTVTDLAFSVDGLLASASIDETIKLWDEELEIRRFLGHQGQISTIDFSPDGRLLASGANDQLVKIWDVATGRELATLEGHEDSVFAVAFNPDSRLLASCSGDGTIRLWDVEKKQTFKIFSGHTHHIWSLDFSPDGSSLVSGSWDGTVRIWNVMSDENEIEGSILATFDTYVLAVAFSPDGTSIAAGLLDSGSSNTIHIWDVATSRQIRAFDTKSKHDIAFSPARNQLAVTGSSDGEVKIWTSNTDPPTLLYPTDNALLDEQTVILEWTPIKGAVYYEMEIARDSDFADIALPVTIVVTEQFAYEPKFQGTYWWRVRTGGFSQLGVWSKEASFKVNPPRQCLVRINPSDQTVRLGEDFHIDIYIENVGSLAAFHLELTFDPEVLEILRITKAGGIFGIKKNTLPPDIDNENGIISNIVVAKTGAVGVSGSGILLTVHGNAKAVGISTLTIRKLTLVNPEQELISNCKIIPGNVVVELRTPWDINQDGVVDVYDLVILAQHFGEQIVEPIEPNPDVDGNGVVDLLDFALVGKYFGEEYDVETTAAPLQRKTENGERRTENSLPPSAFRYVPLLKKMYAIVDENSHTHPHLIHLKQLLHTLIHSAQIQPPPLQYQLAQNYPNPFNPDTWIPYQLAAPSPVIITIYEASGRIVRVLELGYKDTGAYIDKRKAAYWDGKNDNGEVVASGMYLYSIQAGSFSATRKMFVLK